MTSQSPRSSCLTGLACGEEGRHLGGSNNTHGAHTAEVQQKVVADVGADAEAAVAELALYRCWETNLGIVVSSSV